VINLLKLFFKILILAIIITVSIIYSAAHERYNANIKSVVPFPYIIKSNIPFKKEKSPILIIGDKHAKRLALFKDILAKKISRNLDDPIKIHTIFEEHLSVTRVKNIIQSYGALPIIIIYIGTSSEGYEQKFDIKDIGKIENNFKRYDNINIQSLLMILPWLSRLIYTPINYVKLNSTIVKDKQNYSKVEKLKKNILNLKLYQREIKDLFQYTKEKGSYLMALTTPINITRPVNSNCNPPLDEFANDTQKQITNLLKEDNKKLAFKKSEELTLMAPNNASVLYNHANIALKIERNNIAKKYFELASSYDCNNGDFSFIHNRILLNMGNKLNIVTFDFNELVYSSWQKNVLFESKDFPQNLYYDNLTSILAAKIRKVLRL
jgi:hypothetical protein